MELFDKIQESVKAIRSKWNGKPKVGIILGTGLGGFAQEIKQEASIPYKEIPYFPESTAPTHKGRMICGKIAGKDVVAMEGRFHFYEGYTMEQITMPVRAIKALGCEILIVSNACGGMNPQFERGDIMFIEDQINLMGGNPLIGKNDERLGVRFPDMCFPYDRGLLKIAQEVAVEERIRCHKGVFVAVSGPNLETRAEYRFLRQAGADVVGMSTVPEVIVAVHSGLKSLGISIITDMCLPDALEPVKLEEIVATANEAEKKLRVLVTNIIKKIPN